MTTSAATLPTTGISYLNEKKGLRSWLTTTDHKRIGIMYLVSMAVFFVVAVCFAVLMRLELLKPETQFLPPEIYNRVMTLHGVIMVFLFIIPSIPAVFGNFIVPIQVGANDVFFPRLNLASWYFYMAGGLLGVISIAFMGPDTGWTFYVPYSVITDASVFLPMVAAFLLGWSSILTGLNMIVTVHRLKTPSMSMFQMPLFVWGIYATSWIAIVATPVVGITLILVLMERLLGVPIFDPSIGGDPVLYQHLFWIYSHPAVYVMVLPAMGVVSEIVPVFSRKQIFGYKFIAISSMAIAAIGSLVWAHHMFTSGMADVGRVIFSFLTFLVSIPSAVKVFNWLATMYKGSIQVTVPFAWACMFIFLFSIGGFTGLMNGALGPDIHIHDTAFIVAHFHYTMFGGTGVMFIAAMFYWFPKMFGRTWNVKAAWVGTITFFIGFNLTYFPLFIAGFQGMPRRYQDYLPEYTTYHQLSTYGSWVMVSGLIMLIVNFIYSAKKGRAATQNPWGGATLEWTVPSPPPTHQFAAPPVLTHGPYDYTNIRPDDEEVS